MPRSDLLQVVDRAVGIEFVHLVLVQTTRPRDERRTAVTTPLHPPLRRVTHPEMPLLPLLLQTFP